MIHFHLVTEIFRELKQTGTSPLMLFGAVSGPTAVNVLKEILIAPGYHDIVQ